MEMRKAALNIINYGILCAESWFTTLWSGFFATMAVIGGVCLALVQKYLIRDLAFMPWLILVVAADTVAGYMLAKKRWRADPVKYTKPTWQTLREKLAGKLTAVSITLVLLNILTNFEINGLPAQQQFVGLNFLGYTFDFSVFKAIWFIGAVFLILSEARSTFRNLKALGYTTVPKRIEDLIDKVAGEEEPK